MKSREEMIALGIRLGMSREQAEVASDDHNMIAAAIRKTIAQLVTLGCSPTQIAGSIIAGGALVSDVIHGYPAGRERLISLLLDTIDRTADDEDFLLMAAALRGENA